MRTVSPKSPKPEELKPPPAADGAALEADT
ncbi:hypothetical protein GGR36_004352 [Niveibacterium umoris]|uniref:Uncharacterized protein n=1 Tax=Niveibacterium umoris TaxID=1193620 RepID=A0A840BQL6_9RHOO|nr:hypothetical protein [Niveibacterium umoris]